jgi:hypothetical protein
VLNLALQEHQLLTSREQREMPCAAREFKRRQGVRRVFGGRGLDAKLSADIGSRIDHEASIRQPGRIH